MLFCLTAAQKALVIFAALVPQYLAATFCLIKLFQLNVRTGAKVVLNFVILLIPLAWVVFLIYYAVKGRHNKIDFDKLAAEKREAEEKERKAKEEREQDVPSHPDC